MAEMKNVIDMLYLSALIYSNVSKHKLGDFENRSFVFWKTFFSAGFIRIFSRNDIQVIMHFYCFNVCVHWFRRELAMIHKNLVVQHHCRAPWTLPVSGEFLAPPLFERLRFT